eukprot:SAG31_NODE_11429_length_1031_cov_2.570815_1_plen_81_part_01
MDIDSKLGMGLDDIASSGGGERRAPSALRTRMLALLTPPLRCPAGGGKAKAGNRRGKNREGFLVCFCPFWFFPFFLFGWVR